MAEFDKIGEDLFNKIRGRFPSVTIGDAEGNVTNEPNTARFFDFDYKTGERTLGKVSVSVSEDDGLTVIYSKDFIQNEDESTQGEWYNFLKELRVFSKKRMMDFSVRDINKSNLNKRDYQFLANRSEDGKMTESRLYGSSRISYQKFDNSRLVIKHTESINAENAGGRTQKIGTIYIESGDGERFRYPYKHLSGARAMARHVSEGGKPYDDFGGHITGLSEEMAKLRKFKTYMGRSAVMAESLSGYMDIVKERISTVKKTIENLQKPAYYAEAFGSFEKPVMEDVPSDVSENWIDELTIKQFNEELADVFPYIYNLVKEGTKAKSLGPDDLDESGLQYYTGVKKHGEEYMIKAAAAGRDGASQEELGRLKDKYSKAAKNKKTQEEIELEQAFENTMGQFSDSVCEDCGNPSWHTLGMTGEEIEEGERHGNDEIYDKCWKGFERVPGTTRGEKGSCRKKPKKESEGDVEETPTTKLNAVIKKLNREISAQKPAHEIIDAIVRLIKHQDTQPIKDLSATDKSILLSIFKDAGIDIMDYWVGGTGSNSNPNSSYPIDLMMGQFGEDDTDEGNAFANAVRQAKMNGKKKGDKVQGPDGDEITLEKEQKTPLSEFILSYFDRQSGQFPKGETAVLTMIEKDYGEEFIEPAKAFIEQINNLVAERFGYREPDIQEDNYELGHISRLAGL